MQPPLLKGQEKKWRMCIWTLGNQSVTPPPPKMRGRKGGQNRKILATGYESYKPGRVRVQLMIQKIPDINGKLALSFGTQAPKYRSSPTSTPEMWESKRSSCINTNLGCWIRKQKEIVSAVQGIAKEDRESVAEFQPYGIDRITVANTLKIREILSYPPSAGYFY